jgi:cell shape-determining protein MreC
MSKSNQKKGEQNLEPEGKIKINEENYSLNLPELVKSETNLLENKYLRWVISIGLAFLLFKAIDTGSEIKFLMGKQEYFEKSINTVLNERRELIDELKQENEELKTQLLNFEKLKFQNEKLSFENEKLKSKKEE